MSLQYNSQFFSFRRTTIPKQLMEDLESHLASSNLEFFSARVAGSNSPEEDMTAYLSDKRKCKASVIENEDDMQFIFAQFNEVNPATDIWQFDLSFFENIQYLRYESSKESFSYSEHDHFDWHNDMMMSDDKVNLMTRKLSMTLMLSHKEDYTGGEFEFASVRAGKINTKEISLDYGDILIFPSIMEHRVKPVTSGVRNVLVAWEWGPMFK